MKVTGWIVAVAALGMMCNLLSQDIITFCSWSDIFSFRFVAHFLQHISVVIAAFIGGNLVPNLFTPKDNK